MGVGLPVHHGERMRSLVALAVIVLLTGGDLGFPSQAVAASEASAARKTQRVKRVKPPQPLPVYRWRPADPSFDQYGRLYKPPPGLSCPIDLGYGRWTSCNYR